MTLKEIYLMREPLGRLFGQPVPARTAYKLSKEVEAVNKELAHIEKSRSVLVEKYGTKTADGCSVTGDQVKPYIEEFETFLGDATEWSAKKIKLEELGEITISAADMAALSPIIEE